MENKQLGLIKWIKKNIITMWQHDYLISFYGFCLGGVK